MTPADLDTQGAEHQADWTARYAEPERVPGKAIAVLICIAIAAIIIGAGLLAWRAM